VGTFSILTPMLPGRGGTLISRLAAIGHGPDDDEAQRVAKATLTLANVHRRSRLCLGRDLCRLESAMVAAIPFVFQLAVVASLVLFARTKRLATLLRTGLLSLMGTLPFLLQWSLGGFAKASGVAVWAVVVPMLAYLFGARPIPWTIYFVALSIVTAALDPWLAATSPSMPSALVAGFFALNLIGVATTTLVAAWYSTSERDRARRALAEEHRLLGLERERSERLLLNILPADIAERLKAGEEVIADSNPDVTVLFADLVGFTPLAERLGPEAVVRLLNDVFSAFDEISAVTGVEKIKTIGDEYMVVAGLDGPSARHAEMAEIALRMRDWLRHLATDRSLPLRLRIGIHSGPVVAGVIGRRKFSFDLWGDTVNTASRMQSTASRPDPDLRCVVRAPRRQLRRRRIGARSRSREKGSMRTSFLEETALLGSRPDVNPRVVGFYTSPSVSPTLPREVSDP
jgi:adenylate cyclase